MITLDGILKVVTPTAAVGGLVLSTVNFFGKASKKSVQAIKEDTKETNTMIKTVLAQITTLSGQTDNTTKTKESPVETEVKTTTVKTEKPAPKKDEKKAS